ncbi:MAG TPA: glycerophosphodiester phosphodiesterase [Burkholderiaceae bacterium]|nr:glycerophosphodiester phosphodiesterase [Burkholderiaceae bacterium]
MSVARALIVMVGLAWVAAASPFDLQGHRGARGLEPENTLHAFARALSIGVTTLELDVGVTADDVLVVTHDRRLNPDHTRDACGREPTPPTPAIRSLTLKQLRMYEVGIARSGGETRRAFPRQRQRANARIPTLDEVFEFVGRHDTDVRFNIETKLSPLAPDETASPQTFARLLVESIRRAGLVHRASVQSFDWRTLALVRALAPDITVVHLSSQQKGFDTLEAGKPHASPWTNGNDIDNYEGSAPKLVAAMGGTVWAPNALDATPRRIGEAKALGLKVIVWTVNEPDDMARLIDLGVDGLITDYPNRLRRVMASRAMPLPRAVAVFPLSIN